jgi:hypothetical protein
MQKNKTPKRDGKVVGEVFYQKKKVVGEVVFDRYCRM